MSFPTAPTDGQVYTSPDGIEYQYVLANNAWKIYAVTAAGLATGVLTAAMIDSALGYTPADVASVPTLPIGTAGIANGAVTGPKLGPMNDLSAAQIEALAASMAADATADASLRSAMGNAFVHSSAANNVDISWSGTALVAHVDGTSVPLGGGGGLGTTWTNVAASRAMGVTYTNTSGKMIMTSVSFGQSTVGFQAVVNGLVIGSTASAQGYNENNLTFLVPSGATYSAIITSGGGTQVLYQWTEMI